MGGEVDKHNLFGHHRLFSSSSKKYGQILFLEVEGVNHSAQVAIPSPCLDLPPPQPNKIIFPEIKPVEQGERAKKQVGGILLSPFYIL